VPIRNNAATIGTNAYQRNDDPDAVFVVNGSSRGIGLQFVQTLARRTRGKIVACCRSPDTAHDLQTFAAEHPNRIHLLTLDVERQSTIDDVAYTIAKEYRRVDALFNVAGILGDGVSTPGPERTLAAIERGWLEKTLAINVVGPLMLIKALSPLMRTTGGRKALNINYPNVMGESEQQLQIHLPNGRPPTVVVSLSARVGSISDNRLGGWYSYRLSKSALNQATKTLGLELKRQGTWYVGQDKRAVILCFRNTFAQRHAN
jgi:NAD(P)-dependent dehydrogenase (short-subunit alcohol dehydrogenase family)